MNFDLSESWEAGIGLPTEKGLTVTSVKDLSLPLQRNDIVTKINGISVHSKVDVNEAIKNTYDGKTLTVEYTRGSETLSTTING